MTYGTQLTQSINEYSSIWRQVVHATPLFGTIFDPAQFFLDGELPEPTLISAQKITLPDAKNHGKVSRLEVGAFEIFPEEIELINLAKRYAQIGIARDIVPLVALVACATLGITFLYAGLPVLGVFLLVAALFCLGLSVSAIGGLHSNYKLLQKIDETVDLTPGKIHWKIQEK